MQTAIITNYPLVDADPANDTLPYEAAIDICDLVSVEEVMEVQGLGPNGALIHCMELLEASLSWLTDKVSKLKGQYLIFDFPGQVSSCKVKGVKMMNDITQKSHMTL